MNLEEAKNLLNSEPDLSDLHEEYGKVTLLSMGLIPYIADEDRIVNLNNVGRIKKDGANSVLVLGLHRTHHADREFRIDLKTVLDFMKRVGARKIMAMKGNN